MQEQKRGKMTHAEDHQSTIKVDLLQNGKVIDDTGESKQQETDWKYAFERFSSVSMQTVKHTSMTVTRTVGRWI